MDTEILTYSRAKGAFAGLTLEGASLRQDNDSRHAMYGRKVTTRALLLGKVPVPVRSSAVPCGNSRSKSPSRSRRKRSKEQRERSEVGLRNWAAAACHPVDAVCSSGGTIHRLSAYSVSAEEFSRGR